MKTAQEPLFVVNAVAPIRICDNGGWTDTWFAGHGEIFNIGVYPYAEVQIAVFPSDSQADRIVIDAENFGERYALKPSPITGEAASSLSSTHRWDKHPLLEAAVAYMQVPREFAFEINIYSDAPAGASTGTSSAVTVALIGALDALRAGGMSPHEIALAAQKIETEMLGQQCGIQDQLCSAYGGINYIHMTAYPHATVSSVLVSNEIWWELERRLVLIYLGSSHSSSQVHEMVIRSLEDAGPDCVQLQDLRGTAALSRDAVYAGDFAGLGAAMIANTAAQARLHPALVSPEAARVIEIARAHGVLGWKVNGAGGSGGSLTLLCGDLSRSKRALIGEIEQENPAFRHIPIYLSWYGLRVWKRQVHKAIPNR